VVVLAGAMASGRFLVARYVYVLRRHYGAQKRQPAGCYMLCLRYYAYISAAPCQVQAGSAGGGGGEPVVRSR